MSRAVWKGRVQFGTIDVPVKLYSAVGDIAVHSHFLHDQDQIRLEQRMLCTADGNIVSPEEVARAYEVTKDEYVVIESDELDFAEPEDSRQISVTEFVEASQIDARFLDHTYYLGPDNDNQLYINLMQSLQNTNSAGICQWVMRKKSYIGVLMYMNDILTLTTHRYADEITSKDDFKLEDAKITKKEITIAKNLVLALEEKFSPEKYKDEYQAKLQKLIEKKAKGQKIELPALEKIKGTEDKELLNMLEKSLQSLKKK